MRHAVLLALLLSYNISSVQDLCGGASRQGRNGTGASPACGSRGGQWARCRSGWRVSQCAVSSVDRAGHAAAPAQFRRGHVVRVRAYACGGRNAKGKVRGHGKRDGCAGSASGCVWCGGRCGSRTELSSTSVSQIATACAAPQRLTWVCWQGECSSAVADGKQHLVLPKSRRSMPRRHAGLDV